MQAKFTEGPVLRHICTMTFASMAGLLSLFMVDLMDMYWLSLLGEVHLAAAIGYAGSILFFTLSLCIGLSIGCGAIVSQAIGSGDREQTRRLIGNIFLAIFLTLIPIMILVLLLLEPLLGLLGAEKEAHTLAYSYMVIVLPSMPILGLAMACSGVMRALGNARQAMYLTLLGGLFNAALDPLFIFGLDLGIRGAALATVLSRVVMLGYGLYLVLRANALMALPSGAYFLEDIRHYGKVAFPAALTNLATPVGTAYVTAVMAQFGDSAVAGNAIVGKLQSVAFAGLFALSGAVGPIVGQNLGAKKIDRISDALTKSAYFIVMYCVVACSALFIASDFLIAAFNAEGDAALLIHCFCYGLSSIFVFHGLSFCSNAFFNNLKVAHWATATNIAKASLFTMPFVSLGARWGGPVGVWVGLYLGAAIIGLIGFWLAHHRIRQI